MPRFGPLDKFSRNFELLSTELDHETILLSIDAGAYYGLEGPAQKIWEELRSPLTFSELVYRLLQAYRVSRETCTADVERFLRELEREGLLHVE